MDVPPQPDARRPQRGDESRLSGVGQREVDLRPRQLDRLVRVHRSEHQHFAARRGRPSLERADGKGIASLDHIEGIASSVRERQYLGESVAIRVSLEDAAQPHAGAEHLTEDARIVGQRAGVDLEPRRLR